MLDTIQSGGRKKKYHGNEIKMMVVVWLWYPLIVGSKAV